MEKDNVQLEEVNESTTTANNKKKLLYVILACVLVVAIGVAAMLAGKNGGGSGTTGTEQTSGEKVTYTVNLETAGGMAMSEIDVYIYNDSELSDMQDYAKTNAEGQVTFTLPQSKDYAIVLSGVAKGYDVQSSYSFEETKANIILTSSLISDEDISTAVLGLGDVMYDFTVTTASGEKLTLSEVLKEKKMVMLNFWYTTCSWCLTEFPIMDEVYQQYKDDIEIIALDPMEDSTMVQSFQETNQLSFVMASCPASWANTFSVSGYPTSVFIDQYGVICLVESGAITSKRPFVCAFEHFTADNYEQKICENGVSDLLTKVKPNVTMDTSEAIGALINQGDIKVTYSPEQEEEAAEYTWPFIAGEKLGESCIYASNKDIDDSYSMLYMDVELKKGQAVGFDYLISSEEGNDVLYVIAQDEPIFQISGVDEKETWKSCYPFVADKDGTYEIVLSYIKDESTSEGDDTVYIDNVRVVDADDIDVETYLPRYAATAREDGSYKYVDVVYNKKDGYYHVGSENGPLLLADLMGATQFNEEDNLYNIVSNGDADVDGVSLLAKKEEGGLGMVTYFSYSSNSSMSGVCTVNKELAGMLQQVSDVAGFDAEDKNEWLKVCKYYAAYGTDGKQLEDPIKGLAPFCALEATVGKNVESNSYYFDRPILPRGLWAKFEPTKSGVYRFTSKSDYEEGIEAWIRNADFEEIYTYEHDERMWDDVNNCSLVYYMEAGETYYVAMAFWDLYEVGTIEYDVEYMGSSVELFRTAAPGWFTYDTDATGSAMYDIITSGITPVLKNGKYYESEHNSLLYADFTGFTNIFAKSIVEMIELGGFDFTKTEADEEVLRAMKLNDNDVEKTKEYFRELWGESYDANAEDYQIEDVFAGRYHGDGEDMTDEIRKYVDKIDKSSNEERNGCVVVDEKLAEILQMLMDKWTFEGVDNSWIKLCYYYDHLGA